MKIAVLVDCDFFLRNHRKKNRHISYNPELTAKALWEHCLKHIGENDQLYRILVYDCPPMDRKVHNPIDNTMVDLSQSATYTFRTSLHRELIRKRSVAMRMGELSKTGAWVLKNPKMQKKLLSGTISSANLKPCDVRYHVTQKGVDMKIGLDIASLTLKRLVDRIVLISGDSDFVPAAKLARREGLDVVLDPMGGSVGDMLQDHVDGVESFS